METTLKTRLTTFLRIGGIAFVVTYMLVWLAMQGYAAAWTGFGQQANGSLQAKTLWDWMNLLLIPLMLAAGVFFLNRSKRVTEQARAEEHAALEHEIATDNQQEEALQAYFDRIIELVLKEKLSKFSPEEVRNAARTRTLSVLRRLDAKRKGMVVLFLKDSGLIDREAVVDLCGADLTGASLPLANLSRANLSGADLSGANLQDANLSKSFLGETNLHGANLGSANLAGADLFESNLSDAILNQTKLMKANLTSADLRGCSLNEADLRGADLTGVNLNVGDLVGADLRGAKLGGAKLLGADLSRADLSQADLSGTDITESALERAKSLEGATMPDGTKHN
jgi:uncharacterized protein YjbI with pentapeptide repeats